MIRRRLFLLTYITTVLTSSLYVEGVPRPIEYLQEVGNQISKRIKRGAIGFHRAISCHQPDIIILGTYGSYGCFCGFSGKGVPIDDTDKCCKRHDECYAEAENITKTFLESLIIIGSTIFTSYDSECREGKVVCAKNSPFKDKLCNCDKEAALCFHKASASFHPQLMKIDTEKYCKAGCDLSDLNLTTHFEDRYHKTNLSTSGNNTKKAVKLCDLDENANDRQYHQIQPIAHDTHKISEVTTTSDTEGPTTTEENVVKGNQLASTTSAIHASPTEIPSNSKAPSKAGEGDTLDYQTTMTISTLDNLTERSTSDSRTPTSKVDHRQHHHKKRPKHKIKQDLLERSTSSTKAPVTTDTPKVEMIEMSTKPNVAPTPMPSLFDVKDHKDDGIAVKTQTGTIPENKQVDDYFDIQENAKNESKTSKPAPPSDDLDKSTDLVVPALRNLHNNDPDELLDIVESIEKDLRKNSSGPVGLPKVSSLYSNPKPRLSDANDHGGGGQKGLRSSFTMTWYAAYSLIVIMLTIAQ
ncbi:uncharacterized protein LOC143468693 [Clavelina lepadiformis]|uniref:Phospholipase A2-like central domain-containing protein n=1 Tax=Clavelina lepadiformis TaxID=159417 RepID=A0ABP0H256_CLALP